MLQNNKVRLMTRLAIYDKKYGTVDRKKSDFFRWDFIYFNNFKIRAGVLCGCLILVFFYALKLFTIDQVDFMALDIKAEATKVVIAVFAILAFYTLIGTIIGFKEYSTSRNRLDTYFAMLDKLDELNGKPKKSVAEDPRAKKNHFEQLEQLEDVNLSEFDPVPQAEKKKEAAGKKPEIKLPAGVELLKKKDVIGAKKADDELVATSQSASAIMNQKTKAFDKKDILEINDSGKPKKAADALAEKTKYNTIPPTSAKAEAPKESQNVRLNAQKKKKIFSADAPAPEQAPPPDTLKTAEKAFRAADAAPKKEPPPAYGIRSAFEDYSSEINDYVDKNKNQMKGGKK